MEDFENEVAEICRCMNWVRPAGFEWELFRDGYEPEQGFAALEAWRQQIISGCRSSVYPYRVRATR